MARELDVFEDNLLDDDIDGDSDIGNIIRTNRGGGQSPHRKMSDYRRSNRFTEDGYGDSDFS